VSRSWLNQFNGLFPGEVEIDDQVDGISGATVSVQALIQDINQLPIVQ
jgi:major membrane immunogen (membrane-anchored lipoprotein)